MIHHAQSLSGMKAYRLADGTVTLSRPEMNMKRMNTGAQRLMLPTFNGDAFIECIKALITPKEPGHSLYIRPTLTR